MTELPRRHATSLSGSRLMPCRCRRFQSYCQPAPMAPLPTGIGADHLLAPRDGAAAMPPSGRCGTVERSTPREMPVALVPSQTHLRSGS